MNLELRHKLTRVFIRLLVKKNTNIKSSWSTQPNSRAKTLRSIGLEKIVSYVGLEFLQVDYVGLAWKNSETQLDRCIPLFIMWLHKQAHLHRTTPPPKLMSCTHFTNTLLKSTQDKCTSKWWKSFARKMPTQYLAMKIMGTTFFTLWKGFDMEKFITRSNIGEKIIIWNVRACCLTRMDIYANKYGLLWSILTLG